MKYIANIITKSKLDVSDYINVVNDIDGVDLQIPTLIVGWSKVKEFYPDADILVKQINETVCWTYSNREKRQEYEPDLAKFIKNVFENLESRIKYTFFNVLTSKLSKVKGLINYINSPITKFIYISDKSIYIYDNKQVIGVSLSDLEYYGIHREKILDFIKRNPKNRLILNDNFLSWKLKRIIGDNGKIIPYLYSLRYDIF
jgi:hypothetical protein